MHIATLIIAGINLAFAVAAGVAGCVTWMRTRRFLQSSQSAPGIVVSIRTKNREGQIFFYPVFQFADSTGTTIEFTSNIGHSSCPVRVGDRVDVLYDPRQPEAARINRKLELWWLPSVFAVASGITLLQTIVVLVFDLGRIIAGLSIFQS
ncbi:MAG: DUF3592 domain-containing protein [Acidimicrobiia bacterium]|nr:DUF3592 domain-containing protein [Acidimicrobiia bacterium]